MAKSVKPSGRDAVLDAILDAAERLFATSGPADVSLRSIAAEAGVTYGLVHAYAGNKDELYDRVMARYAARWVPRLDELDYEGALDVLLGPDPDAGPYLRLLAWSLLRDRDAGPEVEAHRRHAALDRLPELPGGPGADGSVATAAALALAFGWRFFHPFLRDALRLAESDDDLHAAIRGRVHALAADLPE